MSNTNLPEQPESGEAAQQAFAQKALGDALGFANVLMCILGDRLGLFRDLAANGPTTSTQLAGRTGIAERYAREWLSQMTCAEYLKYDPDSMCFSLPQAHVTTLAAEGHPGFLGGMYQSFQSLENGMISKLLQAFRTGNGIAYAEYDENNWDGLDRDKIANFNDRVVEVFIPAVPEVKAALEQGARVTDVGCGRGGIIIALAKAFPKATFIGYDIFGPSIDRAKANARVAGVEDRVRFVQQDVAQGLTEKSEIMLSVYSLHHATNVLAYLQAIRQALKAGGTYICLEPACHDRLESNIGPGGARLYAASVRSCVPQVLSEGTEALGAAGLPPLRMQQLCAQAGFSTVRLVPMDGETSNIYEAKV